MATAKKRRIPNGFKTWRAYMASIRPKTKTRKRSAVRARVAATVNATRAALTPRPKRSQQMARQTKKARALARVNRAASRGRSIAGRVKRAASASGIVGFATTTAMDAGGIIVGKVIARTARKRLGQDAGSLYGSLIEAAVGLALGMVVSKKSKAWGARLAIGGVLAPMETLLQKLNVPMLSAALGDDGFDVDVPGLGDDDTELVNSYDDGVGDYVTGNRLSGYVQGGPTGNGFSGAGDDGDANDSNMMGAYTTGMYGR